MRHVKAAAVGACIIAALALPLAMSGCGSGTATAPEEASLVVGDWLSEAEQLWVSFEEDGTFIIYRSATRFSDVYIEGTFNVLPEAVRFNVDESTEKLWPPSTVQELAVLEASLTTLIFEAPATFLVPPPRTVKEEEEKEDDEAAAQLTGPGMRELTFTKIERGPNPERIPDIPEEPEEETTTTETETTTTVTETTTTLDDEPAP